MKFIDLKPLSIQRLKAYRKSLVPQVMSYELCDCGCMGCDHRLAMSRNDPSYVNLRTCLDRVNKELARKQTLEREAKQNPAHVYTIAEEKRWLGKKRQPRR